MADSRFGEPGTHLRTILPGRYRHPATGVVDTAVRFYRADPHNRRGDEITHHVHGASLTYDTDRRIHGTCDIATDSPDVLHAWAWVQIVASVTAESQATQEQQLGLFQVGQPQTDGRMSWAPTRSRGTDPTIQLATFRTRVPITFGTTLTGQTLVQGTLYNAGVTHQRIPATTDTLTRRRSWAIGTPASEMAREMTDAFGWYPVFAAYDGAIITRPITLPKDAQPVRTYTLGTDTRIVGDGPVLTGDDQDFANVLTLVSQQPNEAPISYTAINDVATNRHSTTHPHGPGVKAEYVRNNSIENETVLGIVAELLLLQRSVREEITLELQPDLTLGLHEVVEVTVPDTMAHLDDAAGRWEIVSIEWGLRPLTMTITGRRADHGRSE